MNIITLVWRIFLGVFFVAFFGVEALFLADALSGSAIDPNGAAMMLSTLIIVLIFLGLWLRRRLRAESRPLEKSKGSMILKRVLQAFALWIVVAVVGVLIGDVTGLGRQNFNGIFSFEAFVAGVLYLIWPLFRRRKAPKT